MYEELLGILKEEVKPALGCTGPTSVSYAASVARHAVGGKVQAVKVRVDRDTYKNSIAVGIPGTLEMGVDIAAALGAIGGNSNKGLEVLNDVTEEHEKEAKKLIVKDKVDIEINWDIQGVGLYIEVFVETDKGIGQAVVARTHTNVILIKANNKVILKDDAEDLDTILDETKALINKFGTKDFYEFATNVPIEDIEFLKEAVVLNRKLAEMGLEKKLGKGFGAAFNRFDQEKNAYIKAKVYTAAASDARMAGENLSAMACASSGNVGITATVPLVVLAEEYGKSEEILLRSLSLSFLLTVYIKNQIGRLSAMCACAIAASVGVGAGTILLLDGSFEQAEETIKNIVGSIGGVICDGAKLGCALKLSSAIGIAIESAYLAMDGVSIPAGDGLVSETADETLQLLGRIARFGMIDTDKVVCREIIEREQNK